MKILALTLIIATATTSVAIAIYDPSAAVQNGDLLLGAKLGVDRDLVIENNGALVSDVMEKCQATLSNGWREKCSLTFVRVPDHGKLVITNKDSYVFSGYSNETALLKDAKGHSANLSCSRQAPGRGAKWVPTRLSPVALNRCFNEDKSRRDRAKIFTRNDGNAPTSMTQDNEDNSAAQ